MSMDDEYEDDFDFAAAEAEGLADAISDMEQNKEPGGASDSVSQWV